MKFATDALRLRDGPIPIRSNTFQKFWRRLVCFRAIIQFVMSTFGTFLWVSWFVFEVVLWIIWFFVEFIIWLIYWVVYLIISLPYLGFCWRLNAMKSSRSRSPETPRSEDEERGNAIQATPNRRGDVVINIRGKGFSGLQKWIVEFYVGKSMTEEEFVYRGFSYCTQEVRALLSYFVKAPCPLSPKIRDSISS